MKTRPLDRPTLSLLSYLEKLSTKIDSQLLQMIWYQVNFFTEKEIKLTIYDLTIVISCLIT